MLRVPTMLAGTSLADSPDDTEELEGMVTVPGNDKDVQIADIPIVTAITTDSQDIYVKPISPMQGQWQYHHSSCSSPETATSLEANPSCPATDRDHMYSQSHSPTSAIIAENKHLKGMLMAHLDIIQQQSETILSKDKLLKSLREETGLLRQKLSRMTRRLRPGEEGGGRRVAGSGRRGVETSEGGEKRGRKRELDRGSAASVGQERPSKRQNRVPDPQEGVEEVTGEREEDVEEESEDQSLPDTPLPDHRMAALPVTVDSVDELRDEFCMQTSPELPRAEVRRRIGEDDVDEEEEEDTRLGPPPGKGKGNVGRKKGRTSLDKEGGKKGRNSLSNIIPPSPAVPALTSSNLYYVGCRNDQQAISVEDKLTEVPSLQRGVEVPNWREDKNHYALCVSNKISLKKSKEGGPTWRIKSTNPLYTTEAAEPTDDASYLKRHDKHEKEEKQRKRWDAQRMRQEQQLQKLRARQEKKSLEQSKSKSDSNCQRTSLLPALEAATAICVEEAIPVSIFGRPLPDTGAEDFNLPWL